MSRLKLFSLLECNEVCGVRIHKRLGKKEKQHTEETSLVKTEECFVND